MKKLLVLAAACHHTPPPKGDMWTLGARLGDAVELASSGKSEAEIERAMRDVETIADRTLHVKLAALPNDRAGAVDYALITEGEMLHEKIEAAFGRRAAATYQLALDLRILAVDSHAIFPVQIEMYARQAWSM